MYDLNFHKNARNVNSLVLLVKKKYKDLETLRNLSKITYQIGEKFKVKTDLNIVLEGNNKIIIASITCHAFLALH